MARAGKIALAIVGVVFLASSVRAQSRVPSDSERPVASRTASRDSALYELIRDASIKNQLPADLMAYRAGVETEISILIRGTDAVESIVKMEQIASSLRWTRAGMYEQRVVGSRSQSMGFTFVQDFRTGWLRPTLYGNRMRLRAEAGRSAERSERVANGARGAKSRPEDTMPVIHPLAADRDRYYTFSGGDTLVVIKDGARRIPIVRVHVHPRVGLTQKVLLFDGDLELDVSRGALVRLRGYLLQTALARTLRILGHVADAYVFIEYENAEHEGKYWLPVAQRIEFQATVPMFGDARAAVRIASRFPRYAINDTTLDSATIANADSLRLIAPRRLVYANRDSIAHFDDWQFPLGKISSTLHSDDFNDVGPDRMRPFGAPRFDMQPELAGDVLHYDRVEGMYTGVSGRLAMRDLAPGVVVRATAGWAWKEQTVRGRFSIERTKQPWNLRLSAGRSLDITNDFRNVQDGGLSPISAFVDDEFDYVDRRTASVKLTRHMFGANARLNTEIGYADDRYAANRVSYSHLLRRKLPDNRGVDEGSYMRSAAQFEVHPNVNPEDARPGYSWRVAYERGDGDLDYQRLETRFSLQKIKGPFLLLSRGDVGGVFGKSIPPQQLFELGKSQLLPGYEEKEFAGSRAAAIRGQLWYTSPFLHSPMSFRPFRRRLTIPGLAPGASVALQSGWADAPTSAARASITRLGFRTDSLGVQRPASRVSDGIRTTATVGLRFFSGNILLGVARPIDHQGPWRVVVVVGREY